MNSLPTNSARWISAALTVGIVVCLLGTSGCAGLRVPRIDPTGERFLIWPKDQPQAAITAGNPTAPPVLTDPFFPAQPTSAVPVQVARPPEVLKVSPERILAPIGSEVVIKAGICEKSGYLLSDQKLQWQLARNGVGQFVEVGGKGLLQRALLPWNQSEKIDNYYATGYTAASPLCISRGTADPSDDVAIRRGDGWVSVTSPVEGTSYVTAYAPNVATWNARKSTAQIHWVDVQWTFPPTTVQSNGQPQLLTTTVTRQSDGMPLEGYLVRYEVADGGALRSESTGQVVEVRTDAQGKATVEVAPTDSGANQSRIDAQLVRPADYGSGSSPKLVIGNGATIVNWNGNEPYFNPGTPAPLPSEPRPLEPIPSQPSPAGPTTAPQLDVEIYRVTPGQVEVDGQVRFEVIIKNVGDAPATGLSLNDRFDRGFRHLADPTGEQEITTDLKYILAPGQQNSEYITFDVTKAGRICHEVIVSSVEGARASKGDCVDAVQPAPEPRAGVQIKKVGPRDAVVGESPLFTVTVTNTGETALTNVEVRDSYPVELAPQPGRDYEKLGNDIIWRIPRLEVGQSKRFDVYAQGLQPSLRATSYAEVSALAEGVPGNYRSASEHTIEIKPLRGGAPGGTVPGGVTNADGNLKIRLESLNDTVRVGTRQRYRVTIENVGQNVDGLVYMRVIFPQGMRPDILTAQGPQNVQTEFDAGQNAIVFTPVKSLRPREVLPYEFNADVNQPGSGTITAEAVSSNSANGVIDAVNVQMIR
ncbi:DUF11 domain-containing protein [Adhaeretor mobilis]|uniref:Large cysteine-rich periplasmic protein omcB n=1 Tax=Adhaeretor mobilis TaxID=1930276 RepID=A0A517MT26_9BACT|nr:DUF11 domain-containing protein [Adhaeretor mobilis]QDS98002.1 Large cysteine-rich periplasmic protein omcB precursor [Adhaeretor mobilis]